MMLEWAERVILAFIMPCSSWPSNLLFRSLCLSSSWKHWVELRLMTYVTLLANPRAWQPRLENTRRTEEFEDDVSVPDKADTHENATEVETTATFEAPVMTHDINDINFASTIPKPVEFDLLEDHVKALQSTLMMLQPV
mmetsp:Transcript_43591/g.115111  ORF Transcript_43591/g.115111 Transcript_43591/m.115111 type:complete len:139 (-) Transcript_43591:405-821(-)